MLTIMTTGNNDDDGGNMMTMLTTGNNADDDDGNSKCWPGAHQATRSPDSCYLDLSICVPGKIPARNMKEHSREIPWPGVGASGLGNLKTGQVPTRPPDHLPGIRGLHNMRFLPQVEIFLVFLLKGG